MACWPTQFPHIPPWTAHGWLLLILKYQFKRHLLGELITLSQQGSTLAASAPGLVAAVSQAPTQGCSPEKELSINQKQMQWDLIGPWG